jgi:hypothetical protein
VKVGFSRQWLLTAMTQGIKCDVNKAIVYQLYFRIAKSRSIKVAGQELQKPVMRRYQVVDMLLVFREGLFICWGELLFAIERIRMPMINLVIGSWWTEAY